MTLKIIVERSSQKGGGGSAGGSKRGSEREPNLKFYCRPKAQEKKTAIWKVAFLLSSLFPRKSTLKFYCRPKAQEKKNSILESRIFVVVAFSQEIQ